MNKLNLHNRNLAIASIGFFTMLVSGCNSGAPRRDPEYAASMPAVREAPPQQANGSIYQAGYNMYLLEDIKARRIGDTLTVKLVEKTDASNSSSSTLSKESKTNIDNPTILGSTPQFGLPGVVPLANTDTNTLATKLGSTSDFTGKGDNAKKNSLTGDITVTVADVLPNGNLVVRGEKRMSINQGNEYIKLSGIVRPLDIATDNSIPSTKIADATIVYNGDGQIDGANKAGWLTRFFTSVLSPF
ncbi:MAG: flagellar basal body L-ring protein FlgH [Gammaproteobacteria bacterium]